MTPKNAVLDECRLDSMLVTVRGQRVIVDADLAFLYRVKTKVLLQAVQRNSRRFPSGFMFRLKQEEFDHLRSRFASSRWGGARYRPRVFTELGVAMLACVLKGDRAVQASVEIVRAFFLFRAMLSMHEGSAGELADLDGRHDPQYKAVFDTIHRFTGQNA